MRGGGQSIVKGGGALLIENFFFVGGKEMRGVEEVNAIVSLRMGSWRRGGFE